MVAKSVVEICLACTSRAMKEKCLPCFIGDSQINPLKGRVLIRIEFGNTLCCKGSLLLLIVLSLLHNKGIWIMKNVSPVSYHLWHAVPILKPLSRLAKKLINEIKTVILNLLFCWLHVLILKDMILKLMFEIITYSGLKNCCNVWQFWSASGKWPFDLFPLKLLFWPLKCLKCISRVSSKS